MSVNYLHLVPSTPLQEIYVRFFPDGFPAQNLPNGLPDLYKRSDGSVFWKLDLTLMSGVQRAALRDWYHYHVRMQRVDYNVDLGLKPVSELSLYTDLLHESGLDAPFSSYMTVEPRNLAIAFCEDSPALARYCVPQEYWQALITNLLVGKLQWLQAEQQRALQDAQQRSFQPPQASSPAKVYGALPPDLRSPGKNQPPDLTSSLW